MLIDYHVHTSLSRDGEGTVEMCCESALLRGIREICFTNHLILWEGLKTVSMKPEEIEGYFEEIEEARENFPRLKILAGLEIDYVPKKQDQIEKILEAYPWDYSLGAVHFLDGIAITGKETARAFFRNKSLGEIYQKYFSELRAAAGCGLFDSLAHLDVIRRYADEMVGEFPWESWKPLVEEVLNEMRDSKITFELNTAGLRQGPRDCYPRNEVLALAKSIGIPAATLATDAHRPDQIGFEIPEGSKRLKAANLDLALFSKRKSRRVKL